MINGGKITSSAVLVLINSYLMHHLEKIRIRMYIIFFDSNNANDKLSHSAFII